MVLVQFSIGSCTLINLVIIPTPISTIEFYITETNTLFLLSLVDIDALKVYLNNLKNVLVIPNNTILIVYYFSYLFLL